jgi:hypothetical protein
MKSLFSKYIWLKLILAVLLLFGGALIIVFAVLGKANILQSGLNIIAAVILFLFGLFAIIATFAFEVDKVFTNGLLYGSACIALGVFLCLEKIVLLEYLVWLLAIFFIVVGGVEIIKGVILLIKKYKPIVAIVVTFIVGTVFVVGGILAIIFNADIRIVFCIIAGALLFLAGVYNLFFGIKEMIAHNKTKEPKKDKKGSKKKEQEEVKELDYTENKDVPVEQ